MKILAKDKLQFHLNCIRDNVRNPNFDITCIERTINACEGDLNKIIDTEKPPYLYYRDDQEKKKGVV